MFRFGRFLHVPVFENSASAAHCPYPPTALKPFIMRFQSLACLCTTEQDVDNPGVPSIVTNLTERGLGVKWLMVEVDEVKRSVIRPDEFFQLSRFTFTAKYRWVNPSDREQEIRAGFENISIAHGEL